MKANRVFSAAFCIFLTNSALAGSMGSGEVNAAPAAWRPVVTLSLGPSWSDPGETQTIYLQPTLPQAYVANTKSEIAGSAEIFLGLQHSLFHQIQAQIGLALAATSNYQLSGDIWQNAESRFNNFNYAYKINHKHVAVKTKLIADSYQIVQPYISGSLGVGFNYAHDFSNTPKIFEVLVEPPFASHTSTAFTYTAGLGLQKSLNANWAIGIGYEFADWGASNLSAAPEQMSNSGLRLNHLYTNQLQLSLSFVA